MKIARWCEAKIFHCRQNFYQEYYMPLQTENLAAESIGAIGLRLTFRGLIYNELANEV
jgi:hypothetical protein